MHRRRGARWSTGLALATAMLVTALPGAQAAPVTVDAAGPPDLGDFSLEWAAENARGLTEALDDQLYKSGVQRLLDNANRQSKRGGDCTENPFGGEVDGIARRYCFDNADSATTEWIPQGVTGVSDAQQDGRWGSAKPLLVSWYDNRNPWRGDSEDPHQGENPAPGCSGNTNDSCNEKGVRVTFLDPASGEYRHVLLVWPYRNSAGNASFDALHADESKLQTGIHAGGIAWSGNYLYVADTNYGVRVFDMRRIMDLNPDGDPSTNDATQGGLTTDVSSPMRIGRHDNVFYSFGYRYVMPQVGAWVNTGGKASRCTSPDGPPRFSFLSIDRSGADTLISGEYCNGSTNGRVARWPLDHETGELGGEPGSGPVVRAEEAYRLPVSNVQGATEYNGTWYLTKSHGCAENSSNMGELVTATASGSPTGTLEKQRSVPAAVGPEDLHVWREHDLLFTVSEHRQGSCDGAYDGRVLYGVTP